MYVVRMNSLVHQVRRCRPRGREVEVRVARDLAAKPFLGKWFGNRIGAKSGLYMRELRTCVARCPRPTVGRKRVALDDDQRRGVALEHLAQFDAKVLVRGSQMMERRQRWSSNVVARRRIRASVRCTAAACCPLLTSTVRNCA